MCIKNANDFSNLEDDESNCIIRSLLSIWSELLNQTAIGLEDSFFYLGSDSITVLKLLFRIRQTFGISLVFRDIFDNPTIKLQSLLIQRKKT